MADNIQRDWADGFDYGFRAAKTHNRWTWFVSLGMICGTVLGVTYLICH